MGKLVGGTFAITLAPNVLTGERLQELQHKLDSGVYEKSEFYDDISDLLAGVGQWKGAVVAVFETNEVLRVKLARKTKALEDVKQAKFGAECALNSAKARIKELGG